MSFLTIVAGVVLLQLSKSAKDVPDAAVFSGDLNQIRTIAEQEQPETEPKADALRGTASIIRRLSQARQKMELEEARRLHDEMAADHLAPVGENEGAQYEWDGLRRRRTTLGSHMTARSRPYTPRVSAYSPHQHPPLGMSYFPADYDQHNDEPQQGELRRPSTEHGLGTGGGGFLGSLRDRARSMVPGSVRDSGLRSPMHPLPLTEIESYGNPGNDNGRPRYLDPNNPYQPPNYPRGTTAYDPHEEGNRDTFGNFSGLSGLASSVAAAGSAGRQSQSTPQLLTAERPGKEAKRQFSFTNFFHRSSHHDADQDHHTARLGVGSRGTSHTNPPGAGTEEERAGLVKGDSASDITGKFPEYVEHEEEERKPTPPPKSARMDTKKEKEKYEKLRAKWEEKELGRAPTWEKEDDGTGGDGRGGNGPAYI